MADDKVGTQMDGLKVVPAGTQVTGQPVTGQPVTGAALPTGGEPVQSEAAKPDQPFNPEAFLTRIQAVLDERDRRLQSGLDKRDANIKRMLAERQGQVNAIGEKAKTLGVPDNQVQALQSALLNDALAEALKEDTPPQDPHPSPLPQGEGVAAEVARAEAQAEAMAELAGLTQDDPEVKLIAGYATPAEYLAKVREACAAKLKRSLAGDQRPAPTSAVTTLGAMGPGGGAASTLPPLDKVNVGALWNEALTEARAR